MRQGKDTSSTAGQVFVDSCNCGYCDYTYPASYQEGATPRRAVPNGQDRGYQVRPPLLLRSDPIRFDRAGGGWGC
jgi:hypothetical protein